MAIDTNKLSFFHVLRNAEHVGLGREAKENMKADAVSIPSVKVDWDIYETAVEHEGIMFSHSPESPETKKIAGLDKNRGQYWREILRRLKFSLKHSDENIKQAAEFLLFILKPYTNAPKANLFAETSIIQTAMIELKKPEALAAIALITGLGELVTEMETLNNELHGLYDARRLEKEKIKELGTLSDYRKVVDKLFISFLESVNAVERINERDAKDPAITAIVERIQLQFNSIIYQLELILKHRDTYTGGGKQKPDITNPEVPGDGGDGSGDGGETPGGGGDGSGDGGETPGGETENPDIENPPVPPFIPDFE